MRLRTQFIVTMLLFGLILAVIAISAIITSKKVEETGRQERMAANIAQGAGELGYLANDFLIYRESPQLKRWQSRFASFTAEMAALQVDQPAQQALVVNLQDGKNRFKEVFDNAAAALGNPFRKLGSAPDPTFFQVSWSRMAVQSQGLVADASRLSRLLRQQRDRLTETRTRLMYVLVGLFGLFLLVSYLLTYQRILKSLVTLRAGTAAIGSGNLDFLIEEKRLDELGVRSQAVHRMTTVGLAVTASKADLEREMAERLRAEEELRRNRERLKITLRSIGDAVIASDASGRITFLNPVAATLTGWRTEDALGQPIQRVFRIVNEQSGRPADNIVERVLREGSVLNLANDTILISQDGRKTPIEDSAAPIEDSAGNIIGVVLVFHDVTEKRRAQEALRESEEHYRSLFDNMLNGYAYCRMIFEEGKPEDFIYLNVNQAFETLTGLKEVTGKKVSEVIPGIQESDPGFFEIYGRVAATGVPERFETYLEALRMWLSISVYSPRNEHFVVVFDVITEQKKAEEALRESETKYRNLFENMAEEVHFWRLVRDEAGRIETWRLVDANPPTLKTWGRASLDEIKEKTTDEIFGPGSTDHYLPVVEKIMTEGVPYSFEDYFPNLDRYFRFISVPLGEYFITTGADITGIKKAEERLKRAHDELEVRVRERTLELSEAVERLRIENIQRRELEKTLRESENRVRFFASQSLKAQEEERRRIAGELHDSVIASLSALKFRIEKTAAEFQKGNGAPESLRRIPDEVTEINNEIRRIMADLRPAILDDLGIVSALNWFCREYEKTNPQISVDKRIGISETEVSDSLKTPIFRISQEAMNNIAKYSQASLINLFLLKEDGKIKLTIQDNGNGFDPNRVRKGMGLSTMRERTELSGGSFDLESAAGEGTVVRAEWKV